MNPQHPDLESDALPLELLACSRIRRYHIKRGDNRIGQSALFGFAMSGMLSTKSAIFIKLKFIRSGPFIFGGRVISVFTLWTRKGYNYSHLNNSFRIIPGLNDSQQNDPPIH